MASSYTIFRNWNNANEYNEELKAGSNEDYLEDKIFNSIKCCFNGIYDTAKWNRKYYFDLKANWALLRKHDYDAVLDNINEWLQNVDDRFDGKTWTEKVQAPKTTNKTLIRGEAELQKYLDIITEEPASYLCEHDDGVRNITFNNVDFEIDDEDYDRIYFNTPHHNYHLYKRGIELSLIELFEEAGITNYKINTKFGEIKFYQ